jgi:hypothetical protein
MDKGSLITGLVLILLCVLPFVIFGMLNKKKKGQ